MFPLKEGFSKIDCPYILKNGFCEFEGVCVFNHSVHREASRFVHIDYNTEFQSRAKTKMQNTQQKPIYMPKTSTPKPDSVRSIQTAKETIVILNNTKNIEHKDAAKYHVDEPKVAIKTDLSKKNDQNSEKEQPGVKRQVNQSDKPLQSKKCPVIKAEVNQRIPLGVETKDIGTHFGEFERIYKSNTNVDISDIALLKEKELYLKSNPKTYRNTISLELSRLKKQTKPEILKRDIDIATEKEKPKDTHEADRKVEYRQININANDPNVFEKLLSMTLTKQKLELMDYPLPKVIYAETIRTKSLDLSHKADSTPGDKLIKGQSRRCNQDNANYGRLKPTALVGTRTRCYKCQKVFTIQLPTKNPSVLTECLFHHGKLLARNPLVGERISSGRTYSCCGGDTSSNPCDVGPHSFVSDSDGLNHALVPYRFSEKVDDRSSRHALLALDCEMCPTVIGHELIRLTVLDSHGTTLLDELVKPVGEVLTLNSRFSGVESLDGAKYTFAEIQSKFLSMISKDTILLGHGLENDLRALRIVHENVIDTADMFPHHLGLPYRYSLKLLASKYLKSFIQSSAHDSKQDAYTCLELVAHKLLV